MNFETPNRRHVYQTENKKQLVFVLQAHMTPSAKAGGTLRPQVSFGIEVLLSNAERFSGGMTMAEDTLFVYGSLTQGMVHYSRIANYIESQLPATARGTVYRLEVGFPVFVN
ncbi:MAG TPA: hypothetical protein VFV50_03090, partial [Bdellovibrionales bacterium]|nr:hypothetical protein [Bdellovibrionales bacterium]